MNKINNLIKKLCPNGVEYIRLGDVFDIKNGNRIIKSMSGKYPVIGGGVVPTGYYNNYNFENAITIARVGSAGYVSWQESKFWATDVCFVVSSKKAIVMVEGGGGTI